MSPAWIRYTAESGRFKQRSILGSKAPGLSPFLGTLEKAVEVPIVVPTLNDFTTVFEWIWGSRHAPFL